MVLYLGILGLIVMTAFALFLMIAIFFATVEVVKKHKESVQKSKNDLNRVIGKVTSITEDEHGIKVEFNYNDLSGTPVMPLKVGDSPWQRTED